VKTTCPYCGVGCGVIADRDSAGAVTVRGDPLHPANFGRLCAKGSALAETIGLEGRLLAPVVNGQEASWDTALDHVADGFARIVREHGPDSVAFYVSGQILTEDYYVINKLAKGFIGTANIDTNSRLCMASSVAGHKRAFGSDTVPGCYEDLETADLLVLVGSNAAWCHPILYQRMVAAKASNPACRIVVIDPRRTATCDGADLHLPLRSGSDSVLFNGLLAHLASTNAVDGAFVDGSTTGAEAALQQVAGQTVAQTADICGLAEGAVALFFDWFAKTERVVTLYSQGVNQSSSGVDKVNAIINCHLLTGRIGRPGMGPFSLTGQPNAMGGREVGGLANQLAAHMEIENPKHRDIVQRFWQSPVIADKQGLKADRHVRRDRRPAHQGGLDHVHQSAGQPAGCRSRAPRARCMRARRRLRLHAPYRHHASCRRLAAGAHLGRKGRHRHQLRTPHLPAAAVPAGARRCKGRLADGLRRRAAHGFFGVRLSERCRDLPRARETLQFRE
jgi:assimilatory nitrate reductase catalytic subunit